MNIEFDMYQTLALAVLVLLLGSFLKKHIHFLEKFCIPAPVIGGLLFAIFTCICYPARSMYGFFLYFGWISGKSESIKKWRKINDYFPLLSHHLNCFTKPACSWSFQTAAIKSACRYVYRINSNGRRPRYCRCLWTGFGGF